MATKQQPWRCIKCGKEGAVEYETNDGTKLGTSPSAVPFMILNDHTARSPECDGGMMDIQVDAPPKTDSQ